MLASIFETGCKYTTIVIGKWVPAVDPKLQMVYFVEYKTDTMIRTLLLQTMFVMLLPLLALAQSDPEATAAADRVMVAIGGTQNWEETRHLQWTFMDRRLWYWDKWTGDVRCENVDGSMRIAMNVHNREGSVWLDGVVQTHSDSLAKYLERGYRMWINDSYWLVMPFKLRDPGVTLKYLGMQENNVGVLSAVLEMTFAEVGVTPDNKYHVFIDPSTDLVVQWDYYRHYDDDEPRISTPWNNYKKYGAILLSDNRGDRNMGPIEVFEELPERIYSDVAVPAASIK